MNISSIIFSIISLICGIFIGFILFSLINKDYIRDIEDENKHFRKELANTKKSKSVEIIEIADDRLVPEEDYFRPW